MLARQELERDERRPAAGGALVLEAAAEQLELLPEPELADGSVGERADAVVGVSRVRLDLVVPLRAELRELALRPALRERVGLRGGLGEGQAGWSERGAGPT
jgi:hypothetical protein